MYRYTTHEKYEYAQASKSTSIYIHGSVPTYIHRPLAPVAVNHMEGLCENEPILTLLVTYCECRSFHM